MCAESQLSARNAKRTGANRFDFVTRSPQTSLQTRDVHHKICDRRRCGAILREKRIASIVAKVDVVSIAMFFATGGEGKARRRVVASTGEALMISLKTLALVGLTICVSACSSLDKPMIEPPDEMAKLSNADLSPSHPSRDGQRPMQVNTGSVSATYPGDNRVDTQAFRPSGQGVSRKEAGFELNFTDTELADLAKAILKDTLGLTYVFDSHVEGRVTLSTGGPVTRAELISILESVLATNHAALLIENNLYRIVPEADAHQQGISAFDYVRESHEVGAGYGVSIFALRYVSTDAMMRMLDGLMVKQDDLRASVSNNLLFVRGSSQVRQSVIDIISMFDVDWMKGQSAGIFKLNNAAPDDVIKELQQVFQVDRQGKGMVKFQPIARLNAILVLAPRTQTIDKVAQWVSRLDRSGADDNNFYVYRVENGRAKDLAQLLTSAFSGSTSTGRGPEEKEVAPSLSASRTSSGATGAFGSSGGSTFGSSFGNTTGGSTSGSSSGFGDSSSSSSSGPLKSAPQSASASDDSSSDDLSGSSVSDAGSDQVRITPDERNNKLLIKASERNYKKILQISTLR